MSLKFYKTIVFFGIISVRHHYYYLRKKFYPVIFPALFQRVQQNVHFFQKKVHGCERCKGIVLETVMIREMFFFLRMMREMILKIQ